MSVTDADRATAPVQEGGETAALPQPTRKDIWDKLPALTGFFASVVLGVIGLYFTLSYQEAESQRLAAYRAAEGERLNAESLRNTELKRHESQLNEIKIFETFISHLVSEKEFSTAILGIQSLNEQLGYKLLDEFARNGSGEQQRFANRMLEDRSIDLLNNWNVDGVSQEQPRYPAYLDRVTNDRIRTRCQQWERRGIKKDGRLGARFTITRPYFIRLIKTYHYNGNCGSDGSRSTTIGPAGETVSTIGLREIGQGSENGRWPGHLYYETTGIAGEEDVKVATAWIAYPNVMLASGTYEITDSDADTWSFNERSGKAGFTLVIGLDMQTNR